MKLLSALFVQLVLAQSGDFENGKIVKIFKLVKNCETR